MSNITIIVEYQGAANAQVETTLCGVKYLGLSIRHETTWRVGRTRLHFLDVKEEHEAKNSDQEARDQQRGERFRQADEDCGVGASQEGSEADRRQREARRKRLGGLVARSSPWI